MTDFLASLMVNSPYDALQRDLQGLLLRRLMERLWTRRQSGDGQASAGHDLPPTAFDDLIERASRKHGMDPLLVKAVIVVESNFDPQAVSVAGAKGLMQLMDGTARQLGVENSFDVAQNIEGGVAYLARQMKQFGNLRLALAAYNAGPGAVERHGDVPPIAETRQYVRRVLSLYSGDQVNSRHDHSV